MLKFTKSVPYIPDPQPSRPVLGDEERTRAAARPPVPAPQHCRPWTDGQSLGWTLFYGFLTPVVIHSDGTTIHVEGLETLAQETGQPKIIHQFAPGHFGLGTGYTLRTPPGTGSLILPPAAAPSEPPQLQTVTGFVETEWYPRQIFLVFETPPAGAAVSLDRGHPLARVVIVSRELNREAQPLSAEENETVSADRERYLREEQESDTRWIAAGGDEFTHLYKLWVARHRKSRDS